MCDLHGTLHRRPALSGTKHQPLMPWLPPWAQVRTVSFFGSTASYTLIFLSVRERECKPYLQNQYIFTVRAWLKVMDISKSCRAWFCKWPGTFCNFVHTMLPILDINIDLFATFILEKLKWKPKIRGRIKSTYLKYRLVVFSPEKWSVFVWWSMSADAHWWIIVILSSPSKFIREKLSTLSVREKKKKRCGGKSDRAFKPSSYCSLRNGSIRKLCRCQYSFHYIRQ